MTLPVCPPPTSSTAGSRPSWRRPGLTAFRDPVDGPPGAPRRRAAGLELVGREDGPIVDVGSGGGTPGIPLAASLPDREVTVLEAERRKCDFLERWTVELPNLRVVRGRAEEQPPERYGVAVAKALAVRRWRPSGAFRSCAREARSCSGSGRRSSRVASRSGGAARGGGRADAGRVRRAPQDRADPTGIPPPSGRRPQAAARLSRSAAPLPCPQRGNVRAPGVSRHGCAVPARVYAIANQKGGVGKTTTAVNLAACLAEAGERCLIVDLDPQANATSGLALRANGHSTLDLLDGAPLGELVTPSSLANLDLVPAKAELAAATVHLSALEGGERYLADALARGATARYRFVFLDCPPSFGPLTVNALAAADRVVVPVQAEYYALEGLSQLLGSIDLVKRRLNPRLGVAGILLTMVDARTRLAEDVERGAPLPLRRPRLHADRAPLRAPRRGAEPRASRDRLRPALRRRRGLLEGGDGACRAHLRPPHPAAASAAGSRFSSAAPRGGSDLLHLPLDAIHPNPRQPRRRFEPEATSGLAASLRHQGVLQPIVVRPRPEGGYELVAGERRWRAAREAGLETLPALVGDADDRETLLLALVENVARENLSPVEEARAYATLVDEFELSLGDVAERVGRSKPGVSNRLRLLELPEEVLWMLARGELRGHARAVLAVPDDEARLRLARRVARDGLTVRATERAAQEGGASRRPRRPPSTLLSPSGPARQPSG